MEPLGGTLGDQFAALVGPSTIKIFDVTHPNHSLLWPVGGFRGSWIKNHKLLVGGDRLLSVVAESGETSEFYSSSATQLLCVHPVNPTFYVYNGDYNLVSYDTRQRMPFHTIHLPSSTPLLTSIAVCPESHKLLASTMDGRVLGWSMLSGLLENNEMIAPSAGLVKVEALGHGTAAVLDSYGSLYWVDLAKGFHMLQQPMLPRHNLVSNRETGTLCSSFGDRVEVLTPTYSTMLDLSKYGEIVDMGITSDGGRLVARHGRFLTASSLVTGALAWQTVLDKSFRGETQLCVIPFCS